MLIILYTSTLWLDWSFLLRVFQTVHDCSVQCVKSLLRNKKELCSVDLELPPRESRSLTEVGHTNNRSTTLVKIKRTGTNVPCACSDSLCVSASSMRRGRYQPTGKLDSCAC